MQTYKALLVASLGLALGSGCALFGKKEPEVTLRIHEQVSSSLPEEHYKVVKLPRANLKLSIDPNPVLSEGDVQSAELYQTVGGESIMLRFTIQGTIALEELTTRVRGSYLVIFLDKRPVAAWLVDRRITDGHLLVEGDFTDEEARKAVAALNRLSKKRQ